MPLKTVLLVVAVGLVVGLLVVAVGLVVGEVVGVVVALVGALEEAFVGLVVPGEVVEVVVALEGAALINTRIDRCCLTIFYVDECHNQSEQECAFGILQMSTSGSKMPCRSW